MYEEGTEVTKDFKEAFNYYEKAADKGHIEALFRPMPILERDLGWGQYLTNLLKSIINAVVYLATFGKRDSFFPYSQSKINQEATETNKKLQEFDNDEIRK